MTHVDVNELLSYGIKQDLEKTVLTDLAHMEMLHLLTCFVYVNCVVVSHWL